jgi:opacity protein-like surface antigen
MMRHTRKALLCATAVACWTATAPAADLGVPVLKGPVIEVATWTGCYVGGHCGFDVNADETRHGYVVGAGLAGLFSRHWSGFVEYDFLNFGTRTVALTGPGYTFFPGPGFGNNVLGLGVAQFDIKQQIHVFKGGLNYRF